jgi:hypothetical protein
MTAGDEKLALLRHFLAALAYRTQKALRGAPASFAAFRAAPGVRTPQEVLRHMSSVLGYARTFFIGGSYRAEPLSDFDSEIQRFHSLLEDLGRHLDQATPLLNTTPERMLHGPFSDVMTHAGQLIMLRRLAGSPVPPENFVFADIDSHNLTQEQAAPAMPDKIWREGGQED